ncbi:L,D-transpeptidase family protein [Rhizobium sp.]
MINYRSSITKTMRKLAAGAVLAGIALVMAGCSTGLDALDPTTEIGPKLAREIKTKGFNQEDAVLVRIFKEESELELWKKKASGQYALFKTYPICRWSGKLGPKKKTGDRQAPEGFYQVNLGLLNPKSQYYLSFNLGYPNRLESALGYTGEALMVHGACSSSGCFAMTDPQVAELYAMVQKAMKSGQRSFQVQAYPFRMTAANMTRHAGDPNTAFWRNLKQGYDAFERTRREVGVSVCESKYQFNRSFAEQPADPLGACPATTGQDNIVADAAPQETILQTQMTEHAYVDGGMHPSFRAQLKRYGPKRFASRISTTNYPISRPEAALADPFNPSK